MFKIKLRSVKEESGIPLYALRRNTCVRHGSDTGYGVEGACLREFASIETVES